MPKLTPISRRKFITRLKSFGFAGPLIGGNHYHMIKGTLSIVIPNEHGEEISVDLLSRILLQCDISRSDWVNK